MQPRSLVYVLSIAFLLQRVEKLQRLYGPQSLKYLLSGSLEEKFADLCTRMRTLNGECKRKGDFKTNIRTF